MAVPLVLRRLLHSVDNHGLAGTAGRLLARITGRLAPTGPSSADPRSADPSSEPDRNSEPDRGSATPHPFDLAHGTDTSGYIPGEHLGSGYAAAADLFNTAYYGISPSTLAAALERLPTALDALTFVDLGCGKGRALLVAASFPFAHLLGVELSADLAAVAERNCARDPRITVQAGDATRVRYPAAPFVVFMYHPFLAPLQLRVFRAIAAAVRANGQPAFILLANPGYPRTVARVPALRLVWDDLLPLSAEDAAADRHGITGERYILYRVEP